MVNEACSLCIRLRWCINHSTKPIGEMSTEALFVFEIVAVRSYDGAD
jgi:hypothetical protein